MKELKIPIIKKFCITLHITDMFRKTTLEGETVNILP